MMYVFTEQERVIAQGTNGQTRLHGETAFDADAGNERQNPRHGRGC